MKLLPLKLSIWPERPAGFDSNGLALVLLTLPAGTPRTDGQRLARDVLRNLYSQLTGLNTGQFILIETPHGPTLTGLTDDIRVSLSYAGDKVLIGVCRGRALGVDIVQIEHIAEIEALSRLYLPKAARVLETPLELRDCTFAQAWAQMEACCKVLNLPLTEIDEEREHAYANCEIVDCEQINGYRIALSVTPLRPTQV